MLIRILAIGFGTCFAAFGLYSSLAHLSNIIRGYRVATWPTVDATIESCELQQWADENSISYELDIVYAYSVDGSAYRASGIHPAIHEGREPVRSLYLALSGHKKVMVRYNPDNPSEAYLFGGLFTRHFGSVFGELAIFAFGVLFSLVVHCSLPSKAYFAKRLAVVR